MSLTTFSDIPRSILALLLDRVGKAQSMSPRLLMGKPDTLDQRQIAELYAGGFIEIPDKSALVLTPEFVRAARVILDPHTNLTIRIWGKDNACGETNIQFPRDILTGGGVIFNQLGRMYRISAFADDSTVAKLAGEAVPDPLDRDLQFNFKAHLDNTVAAILFAVIDLARTKAVKGTRPEQVLNMVFSTQEVYSYMYDRWTLTGFKDLISYITAVGMMPEAPSLTDTVDGLRVLAKSGILKEIKTDSYGITKAIEPLVRLTIGQPSGLQWQRISLMDNGEQIISNRMFLFADKSLMLGIAPTIKGRLFISKVKRKEITDFLAEEIMASLASPAAETKTYIPAQEPAERLVPPTPVPAVKAMPSAPPPAAKAGPSAPPPAAKAAQSAPPPKANPPPVQRTPQAGRPAQPAAQPAKPVQPAAPAARPVEQPAQAAAQAIVCSNCGAIIEPGKKFCAKCGASVVVVKTARAEPAVCANCGTALKPGAKFCSKCGAVASSKSTKADANMCPNCGKAVKPGAKFCASCGTKI
jgi:uncharacterized OB-fold protein